MNLSQLLKQTENHVAADTTIRFVSTVKKSKINSAKFTRLWSVPAPSVANTSKLLHLWVWVVVKVERLS